MNRVSIKRLSILGLVLATASAVTAAVLPSNNNAARFDQEGSMTNSTGSPLGLTCEVSAGTNVTACNVTEGSFTTGQAGTATSSDKGAVNSTAGDA